MKEVKAVEFTYHMCSNTDVGSTEQELVSIFENKIYSFYIHVSVTSKLCSHSSIQLISSYSIQEHMKFSLSSSDFPSTYVMFYISVNQLVHQG